MGISGDWEAFQFDSAVRAIGVKVDEALAENAAKSKKKRRPPKLVVMSVLGLEPKDIGLKYGSLNDKVTATIRTKPGEDWFNAIRSWETTKERDKPPKTPKTAQW